MTKQNNIMYSFCITTSDSTTPNIVRHIPEQEHQALLEHVLAGRPVYFYNTNFLIKEYAVSKLKTEDKLVTEVSLLFFRPNLTIKDLENYYGYIVYYNIMDRHRGFTDIYDMDVPLHSLAIKPFNSKAGNLLYGKTKA